MQYQQQPRWNDRNNSRERKGNFAQLGEMALGMPSTYQAPYQQQQPFNQRQDSNYNVGQQFTQLPPRQNQYNNPYQNQNQNQNQYSNPYSNQQTNHYLNNYQQPPNQYSQNPHQQNLTYKTQYTNNVFPKEPINQYQTTQYNNNAYRNTDNSNTGYRQASLERQQPASLPWQQPTRPQEDISAAQNSLRLLKQKMNSKQPSFEQPPIPIQRGKFQPKFDDQETDMAPQLQQQRSARKPAELPAMNVQKRQQFWDEQGSQQAPQPLPPKPRQGRRNRVEEPQQKALGNDEVPAFAQGKPNLPVQEYDEGFDETDLIECPEGCGRKFKDDVLDKHTKVCQQVFQKKRKQFDTKSHRIVSDDHAQILEHASKVQKGKPSKAPPPKKNKWKQHSEQFRAMMKQAKGGEITAEEQAAIQASQDDRVQCEYCGRKFSEQACKRHVEFCKEKSLKRKFK